MVLDGDILGSCSSYTGTQQKAHLLPFEWLSTCFGRATYQKKPKASVLTARLICKYICSSDSVNRFLKYLV